MKQFLSDFAESTIDLLIKILIIFVPLFFVIGKGEHYFFSIYDSFKQVAIESIASLLGACFFLKLYADDKIRVFRSPLFWPLLLLLGAILVSVLQAYNVHEAVLFIRRWIANFVILFMVYTYTRSKARIRSYLRYLVFVGGIVSVYGLLQHRGIDFAFMHQNFTGNSSFGNPNFASEYILIVFPMALFLVFANTHRGWCAFHTINTLAMAFFLILNKSRAVWIGGGIGAIIVLIFLIWGYFRHTIVYHVGAREKKHGQFVLKILCAFALSIIVIVILSYTPLRNHVSYLKHVQNKTSDIVREFKSLTEFKLAKGEIVRGDTATQRFLIWANTMKMVRVSSILGVGIGNFKIQYQPYRTEKEQLSTGPDIFVRRSHNEYVQLLAEIGLFGIAFFFLVIIVTIRMCQRMLRESKDYFGQCLAVGFLFSFISTYIAIFFNFSLQTPTPCMTLYFLTGLMMASYDVFLKKEDHAASVIKVLQEIQRLRHGILVFVFILLFLPIWIVRPAGAYYNYQFGQALERMGLKEEAKVKLLRSLDYYYHSWETHFVLANVFAATGDMLKAKEHHYISLGLNPYHQKGHYNLANTLYKIGEVDKAIHHYKEGIKIDSIFYQSYNNLGSILYKENRLEESLDYFKKVTELKPDYFSGQYNMAYILVLLKRYNEALPYIRNAYQLQPNDKKLQKLMNSLHVIPASKASASK